MGELCEECRRAGRGLNVELGQCGLKIRQQRVALLPRNGGHDGLHVVCGQHMVSMGVNVSGSIGAAAAASDRMSCRTCLPLMASRR